MVNYWIFPSLCISLSVKRGVIGKWYLARQTVERCDIEIKKGDKVILYQPSEVWGETQKFGYCYVGNFTIVSEPFIETRGNEGYTMYIQDFNLWKIFLTKDEEESLDTKIPKDSEFGRLITTKVVISIEKEDYEKIAEYYGKKVEQELH
ncbi:MAG: hypothetical protein ACOWW1_05650 [archaeon]